MVYQTSWTDHVQSLAVQVQRQEWIAVVWDCMCVSVVCGASVFVKDKVIDCTRHVLST